MNTAVILCAGAGTKIWPYAQIRAKVMIPISNKPIVAHNVEALEALGFDRIVLVAGKFHEEIEGYFRDDPRVSVLVDPAPKGTAFSLLLAKDAVAGQDFLALYGDTIIAKDDIKRLVDAFQANGDNTVLAAQILERRNDHIGMCIENGEIEQILGHPRDDTTHFFAGFAFHADIFDALPYNSGRFPYTEVGMMVPQEGYLEATVGDEMTRGKVFKVVEAQDRVFDIDKPWQIVEACREVNTRRCRALTANELGEGTTIDPTASIGGFIKTGKNCRIGKNVIIMGNIILGDDTRITNGALVCGDVVIGNDCSIRNACFISNGSTIGNECIVSHAAELDGVIFNRVYLYHYMEFFGVIGENTDLGAATVCGSLRFDDNVSIPRVKGRKEYHSYGDCVCLGDYCRTGVNAILMPGVKTGIYSVVGAGVILSRDLPDRTMVSVKQELHERPWGPEVYGW